LFCVAAMMPTSNIRPPSQGVSLIFCFTAGGKETCHFLPPDVGLAGAPPPLEALGPRPGLIVVRRPSGSACRCSTPCAP
jgi:hypothetical protein